MESTLKDLSIRFLQNFNALFTKLHIPQTLNICLLNILANLTTHYASNRSVILSVLQIKKKITRMPLAHKKKHLTAKWLFIINYTCHITESFDIVIHDHILSQPNVWRSIERCIECYIFTSSLLEDELIFGRVAERLYGTVHSVILVHR